MAQSPARWARSSVIGDFGSVFGGEPGEAIGALSRATSTSDADDDVGVEEDRTSACMIGT